MENRTIAGSQDRVSESSFISKVFMWMAVGLGLSGAASLVLLTQPSLLRAIFTNNWLLFGIIITEFVLVIWLSAAAAKLSVAAAALLYAAYSLLNGVTLTSVLLVYTGVSVFSTFAVTAGTFFFFSVYGMTTKKDLTGVGSLAMMGLFGIILASLVNLFLKSPAVMWVTTFVGIAVFLGLIAYDTQKLKAIYAAGFDNPDVEGKVVILGALTLYLDFINLFLLLLRIFGRRRD